MVNRPVVKLPMVNRPQWLTVRWSTVRWSTVQWSKPLESKKHISNVCRLSFYHIRQLRQIRASLDTNSAIILANALVSSKLDYFNFLYYKLPACWGGELGGGGQELLCRLLNAPIIFLRLSVNYLHWLPIKQRIDYKIASLTVKTVHFRVILPCWPSNSWYFNSAPYVLSLNTNFVYLSLNLNLVNVLSLLLHLLSGTLFPLTFALVLQSLPFILFSKLISFLLRSLLTWTDFSG